MAMCAERLEYLDSVLRPNAATADPDAMDKWLKRHGAFAKGWFWSDTMEEIQRGDGIDGGMRLRH